MDVALISAVDHVCQPRSIQCSFEALIRFSAIAILIVFAQANWAVAHGQWQEKPDDFRFEQAHFFQIKTAGGHKTCTATIFKPFENSCAMVTNAHCFNSIADTVEIVELNLQIPLSVFAKVSGIENLAKNASYQSKLIKRSVDMDLALLEIPSELSLKYCKHLNLNSIQQMNEIFNSDFGVISFGVAEGQPQMVTSSPMPWTDNKSDTCQMADLNSLKSLRTVYQTGLVVMPEVLKVKDLQIFKGMSGGPVFDAKGSFLGINAWLRDQGVEQSFVILASSIRQFLLETSSQRQSSEQRQENNGINESSGGNGHSDGGGNGHSDGNDDVLSSLKFNTRRSVLTPGFRIAGLGDLLMSQEGIVDPKNSALIVLGKGHQSVDGIDDYRKLQSNEPFVYRPNERESYPDLEIRKSIIDRMAGVYKSKLPLWPNQIWNSDTTTRSFVYNQLIDKKFEKNRFELGTPEVIATVDAKNLEITIDIAEHKLFNRHQLMQYSTIPPIRRMYKILQSTDHKQILLQSQNDDVILQCTNNNYMKLICQSDAEVLSIHIKKSGYGEVIWARLQKDSSTIFQVYSELFTAQPLRPGKTR